MLKRIMIDFDVIQKKFCKDMENKFTSLEGKILVASPKLEDKFFEKSLIYIFMHSDSFFLFDE